MTLGRRSATSRDFASAYLSLITSISLLFVLARKIWIRHFPSLLQNPVRLPHLRAYIILAGFSLEFIIFHHLTVLRQLRPILRSGKLCLLLVYITLKLTCSVSLIPMTPANTRSSSTTNNAGAPPTKKVRTQEPQPEAKFKLGDFVVAAAYGDPLFKVSGVEYDQDARASKYKGDLWNSYIEVSAPETLLLKPKYLPEQSVSFKYYEGENFAGKIVSIHVDEDTEITYRITPTEFFNIAEDSVAARDG